MNGRTPNPCLWLAAVLLLSLPAVTHAQANLGTGELRIAGVRLVVSPATQTLRGTSGQALPRDQATGLTVTLEDPAHPGQPLTALLAALLGTFTVEGELTGARFARVV